LAAGLHPDVPAGGAYTLPRHSSSNGGLLLRTGRTGEGEGEEGRGLPTYKLIRGGREGKGLLLRGAEGRSDVTEREGREFPSHPNQSINQSINQDFNSR